MVLNIAQKRVVDTRSPEKNPAFSEGACDEDVALGKALTRRAQQTDHSCDFMAVGANCVVVENTPQWSVEGRCFRGLGF